MLEQINTKILNHIKTSNPKTKTFGEVYTKYDTINDIVNKLPTDLWSNPNTKILDPTNGVGNFPEVLLKKLMHGLKQFQPIETKRYKYIMENIIYVAEIQSSNNEIFNNIFNPNDDINLNVFHGSFLSEDFIEYMTDVWNVDTFNLIIANPPYQSGSNSRNAKSIYNLFIHKATTIAKITSMITPSKWYSNPSMETFRRNMIEHYGLQLLQDVNKPKVFENVDIKGGVSFFILKQNYKGPCLYNDKSRTFKHNIITIDDIDDKLSKISKYKSFNKQLKSDSYFKIKNKDERFQEIKTLNNSKCFVSINNGNVKYVETDTILSKPNTNLFKVFIPTASGSKTNIGILGRLEIGLPTDVCSRSFTHFAFKTLLECQSFISYLNTDFAKEMIKINKQTQLVNQNCFKFIPIIPLDKIWNDKLLLDFLEL